jgi:hypothetical protein
MPTPQLDYSVDVMMSFSRGGHPLNYRRPGPDCAEWSQDDGFGGLQ